MSEQQTVADPLRAKRPPPSDGENGAAAKVSAPDPVAKRIKLEDGEKKVTQPLQKAPEPKTNSQPAAQTIKQPVAVKQAASASIPAKSKVAPLPAGSVAKPAAAAVKAVSSSATAAISKPAVSELKPRALPQPAPPLKQSAPPTQPQSALTSIKPRSVPLAPPPTAAVTALPPNTKHLPRKESPPPLKATTFHHLQKKYGPELDYMLVEFKKLERQLLGAPIHQQQNPPKVESKGSRERREKLHGFILHLEDTVRQVEEGLAIERQEEESRAEALLDAVDLPCTQQQLEQKQQSEQKPPDVEEEEKKSSSDASLQNPQPNPQPNTQINLKDDKSATATTTTTETQPKFTAAEASLSSLPPEKEREESVQRLEEHILANLLPVKVRLTKQLAAQKGATRNPLTAPVRAGLTSNTAGGTIAEAVEAKRKAQEEELLKKQLQRPNHYGKPIGVAGSSLTNRLHPGVLGVNGTTAGGRAILYAGVAPGSTQVSSSVNAVSGAHPGLVGKDATKALSAAEEERRRLKALEENATRVALGKPILDHRKPAALPKQPEGPATLAARARAVALAAANSGAMSKISRPNQQFPRALQSHVRPPLGAAAIAASKAQMQFGKAPPVPYHSIPVPALPPAKPKKPHVTPNFNDPKLTPEEQFELRLKEARWRQRKRRRERRRKRIEGYFYTNTNNGAHQSSVPQQSSMSPSPPGNEITQPEPIASTAPLQPPPPPPSHTYPVPPPQPPPPVINPAPQEIIQPEPPKKEEPYVQREVEYVCAICNEAYLSTCEFNPWWALTSHECPKCHKEQIPKLDISLPANEIEYHPALLSQEDNVKTVSKSNNPVVHQHPTVKYMPRPPTHLKKSYSLSDSEVSFTDESNGEGAGGKYDESSEEEETHYDNDMDSVTREDRAEREEFGFDYKGETLSEDQARRLLVLIEHASICPGRHRSAKHRNVCHSTKYMMLHVRDCCGLLSNGDVCPFPWCRKTKHLLYHLVTCKKKDDGSKCHICCPENLSSNLTDLVGLNAHRRKIFVERVTKAKAAMQSTQPQPIASSQIPPQPAATYPQRAPPKPMPVQATAAVATQKVGNAIQPSVTGATPAPPNEAGTHFTI